MDTAQQQNQLTEFPATTNSPYRCYVKGNILSTEGLNVYTVGFKDGLAVVKVLETAISDDKKMADNEDKKPQFQTLKHVILKIDPETGQRFLMKDGKKIKVVSKINPSDINLNLSKINLKNNNHQILKVKPIAHLEPPPLIKRSAPCVVLNQSVASTSTFTNTTLEDQIKPNIIIKRNPTNKKIVNELLKNATVQETKNITKGGETLKYHVLSLNVKRQGQAKIMTSDQTSQTESSNLRDQSTQTSSPLSGIESALSLDFWSCYLDGEDAQNEIIKKLDPNKVKAIETMKFNFFSDIKSALNIDRSGNLPIHESVIQNDLKSVKKNCLIIKVLKKSVNIQNQQSFTPLHLGIIHDVQLEILQILIDHGADLNAADGEGNTALHLAIEHNRTQHLEFLLQTSRKKDASLDIFNYEGFTPLILAVLNKSEDQVQRLLYYNADPNIKDKKSGRTALFHAAETFEVDLVNLLMTYNADTKIRNFFGTSPHDAMFEIEEMPIGIKYAILGRERFQQQKKKNDGQKDSVPVKKAKLETTPVLRRVDTGDFLMQTKLFRKK